VAQVVSDNSGDIYVLTMKSAVSKLTPDVETLIWQVTFGNSASFLAVDASRGVYVLAFQAPVTQPMSGTLSVEKPMLPYM